jgi:thymidylate synthase (FAD)
MPVKIISYSKPVSDTNDINDTNTIQDLVAYCARVSNPENQNNKQTNEKLIKYLIKNHHWSPLEMVNICLEIETTRDIARQILRHRSFSFQEFSQRYAVADLGIEIREARLQDTKNRQNSIEILAP